MRFLNAIVTSRGAGIGILAQTDGRFFRVSSIFHPISMPRESSAKQSRKNNRERIKMASAAPESIRNAYRTIARLIQRLPEESQAMAQKQLRNDFRRSNRPGETTSDRVQRAGEQIAYLRIVTPKERPSNQSGRWVYKDGERIKDGQGSSMAGGRVHSNWDGNNLDPCSVKRHNQSLKRAGFQNNLHAKGIF